MAKAPSFPMYTADIIRDTADLGALARGVWHTFLMHAHTAEPRGELTKPVGSWATMCGATIDELNQALTEIIANETGNVTLNGKPLSALHVTVGNDLKLSRNDILCVLCRRMVRERKVKENQRDRVRRHREKAKPESECNGDVTPGKGLPSSSSSFSSSERDKSLSLKEGEIKIPEPLVNAAVPVLGVAAEAKLLDWVRRWELDWITRALGMAAERTDLKFPATWCERVLQDWQKNGGPPDDNATAGSVGNRKPPKTSRGGKPGKFAGRD